MTNFDRNETSLRRKLCNAGPRRRREGQRGEEVGEGRRKMIMGKKRKEIRDKKRRRKTD